MEIQFQQYVILFESIVPFETYAPTKAIILGDIPILKDLLKKALINLAQTRYSLDFVNDNKHAIQITTKIVEPAVSNNDAEALLLSMIVKTDYTYVLVEKARQNLAPIEIPNTNVDRFDELYWSFNDVVKRIESCNASFLWIFRFEHKYASLTFSKSYFKIENLENWDYYKLKELFKQQFFTRLTFDSTVNRKGQIMQVFPEDFLQESENSKSNFDFIQIRSEDETPLLLIMDMNISEFPHNLLLDLSSKFIYLSRPIANIISTEWYIKYAKKIN